MLTDDELRDALKHSEIAGGIEYDNPITRDDASVIVRSASDFKKYAGNSNETIWIPGNARIDLSGWSGSVRATIASDRGMDNESPGALLYTTDHGQHSPAWDGGSGRGMMQLRGSAHLTGLRIRGPYHNHYDDDRYPGYIPLDDESSSERRKARQKRYSRGMSVYSGGVEIDNCEVYGWANDAISVGTAGSPASPYIHHCDIHDCMMVAFGYAVNIFRGHPIITHTYMNATRHSLVGFGFEDCGFTLEGCIFGPSTYSHAVDMHCLAENGYRENTTPSHSQWGLRAGGRINVRHCTFCYEQDIRGRDQECVAIRGVPKEHAVVEQNRFMHDMPPSRNPGNDSPGYTWRQVNVYSSNWGDVELDGNGYTPNFIRRNNQFNAPNTSYTAEYGAPIDLMNPERDVADDFDWERRMALLRLLRETRTTLDEIKKVLS